MNINGAASNLINGVSRQSPEVRLPSQSEESINQFPTHTRGLVQRNPSIITALTTGAQPANSIDHFIDRDATEKYKVTISPTGVQVWDLFGNAKTVTTPNGIGYLSGATTADLEAITVADHTFIVNKTKVVAGSGINSAAYRGDALYQVVQGDYHSNYKVRVNGAVVAIYATSGGPWADAGASQRSERTAKSNVIALALWSGTTDPLVETGDGSGVVAGQLNSLVGSGFNGGVINNVIHFYNTAGTPFTTTVEGPTDDGFRVHKGITQDYTKLPRNAPNGFQIKVSGDEGTHFDDYYVIYNKGANDAEGAWTETLGPGVPLGFNASTMPHVLVRNADGTFTFKQYTWADREVGDLVTNPWPSFVGQKIKGLVFTKNRLGFVSGESISMSRDGKFNNFFNETILTQLDTDPVDVTISYPEISTIYHAVPFAEELILFTASVPFSLSGGDLFTPKSVHIEPVLSNKVSSRAKPVDAGGKLFFANDTESGCHVHEFVYDRNAGVREAPAVTDHVQGYIPSGVTKMVADEDLKSLFLWSSAEPNRLSFYKWLWVGNDKAQSAWQKWELPTGATIHGMKIIGEWLYLSVAYATYREIVRINCHEGWTDNQPAILSLDSRTTASGAYDAVLETTTFTPTIAGYSTLDKDIVISSGPMFGLKPVVVSQTGTTIELEGDWTGIEAYIGWPMPNYLTLSRFTPRPSKRDGSPGAAIPGVNLTVSNMFLETGPSTYLNATINRTYRQPYTYNLSAAFTGTQTGQLGALIVGKLTKVLSIMTNAEDLEVILSGESPYPYSLIGLKWSGAGYQKGF